MSLIRLAAPLLLASGLSLFAPPPAAAGIVPFSAVMSGDSNIVEVIDPATPIVRVETAASGVGVLDLVGYTSTDIVNLATGAGSGSNRFVASDGDELFGTFTVQLIPTADPATFDLVGEMWFAGGTGDFAGAGGSATFTGSGTFDSPTHAVSNFRYTGHLALLPEPGSLILLGSAIGALMLGSRRRGGGPVHRPRTGHAAQRAMRRPAPRPVASGRPRPIHAAAGRPAAARPDNAETRLPDSGGRCSSCGPGASGPACPTHPTPWRRTEARRPDPAPRPEQAVRGRCCWPSSSSD